MTLHTGSLHRKKRCVTPMERLMVRADLAGVSVTGTLREQVL